jgi:hypothetical protein
MPTLQGNPLGYQSASVNGQLVNIAPKAAFSPTVYGGAYSAPGGWQRQGVYTVPPVTPSPSQMADMAPQEYGGTNIPSATDSGGSPWSLTKSPVPWVIAFLAFSLFMLWKVHYR